MIPILVNTRDGVALIDANEILRVMPHTKDVSLCYIKPTTISNDKGEDPYIVIYDAPTEIYHKIYPYIRI